MSLRRSASSFSTLRESNVSPSMPTTRAQWNSLPASMPAQALSMRTSVSLAFASSPLEHPADGSLRSEFSPISISGQGLLIGTEGRFHQSHRTAEMYKPSSVPWAPSGLCTRTTQTMVGIMYRDGSGKKYLGSGRNPVFSPDGNMIAFVNGDVGGTP